ncbi:efflux RND transporter permease subunit, partial [Thermodesulfobacteriota bacterium]
FESIAKVVEEGILPLMEREGESKLAKELGLPPVSNFFYVGWGQQVFMGIGSKIQERTRELLPYVYGVLSRIPGMIAIVQQPSLFSRGIGGGRSIDIEIKGPDLERLIDLGRRMYGPLMQLLPGAQIRPIPGLDLGNPELRVVPNRERLTRLGLTTQELGTTVDALVDGTRASHYRIAGEEIDLVVKQEDPGLQRIQDLREQPLQTPGGERVHLGSVAEVFLEEGPTRIQHIDSERAITLQVLPPPTIPLETAMEIVRQKVVDPLTSGGGLGSLYRVDLKGTADKLTKTRQALQWNFILALLISYLLMCALFENFFYPFIIMFSVPLAAAGGFIGLFVLNALVVRQPLDIITMLGFVILVGIVVNNAILIVHQALNNMRYQAMAPREAVTESVRGRLRPVFMSAVTSISGMLPLALSPVPLRDPKRGSAGKERGKW